MEWGLLNGWKWRRMERRLFPYNVNMRLFLYTHTHTCIHTHTDIHTYIHYITYIHTIQYNTIQYIHTIQYNTYNTDIHTAGCKNRVNRRQSSKEGLIR